MEAKLPTTFFTSHSTFDYFETKNYSRKHADINNILLLSWSLKNLFLKLVIALAIKM